MKAATKARVRHELLDFAAHASMAFLFLVGAWILGAYFTPEAAVLLALCYGLLREWTGWQDGRRDPAGIILLSLSGWCAGGVLFVLVTS